MKRRTLWAALLAVAIAGGLSVPAQAQRPGGGGPGGRPGGPGGPGGGPGGFGGPGGGMGRRGGRGNILSMPEVQKELKLDPKQLEKLQALQGQRPPQGGGDQSPEARRKQFAEMRKKREGEIAKILDAKQLARYKQLDLQRAGGRALERDDVAKALKLTADQGKKIDTILKAESDATRKLFQGMMGGGPGGGPGAGGPGGGGPGGGAPGRGGPGAGPGGGGPGGGGGGDRMQAFEKMRTLRTGTDAKLLDVLTAPQKKQFTTMQGAPFKFPARQFGRGGPGGGGPGGGGFGGPGGGPGGRPGGGGPGGGGQGGPRRPGGSPRT